jgi:hypothetical protein
MIEDAREYLVYVKSLVISTPQITSIRIIREETQGKNRFVSLPAVIGGWWLAGDF